HATRYRYDRFGRMTGLINANGERWQFEYDNGVRLLAQTDYAGRRSRYRYDVLGQLTAVTRQPLANDTPPLPEQTTLMEYDALGRISAKQTAEQRTAYAYQPHGITLHRVALARWRQAQSAGRAAEWDETLTFSHDALGNLLSEENHGGRWQHQYDALGNLQQSTTPDGAALRFMRYGSGHLLQVDLQQAGRRVELAGYRRDALHREVTRSQGPLSLETRYDRAGRIVMRRSALLERRYQWDGLDRVTQQMLIQGGGAKAEFAQQRFGYDALGQVTSRLRPQHAERFHYDAAGNRTAHPGQTVWHNLLLRLQGTRWEYDGFGRLAWRRAGRDGTEQRFVYDDEHRVSEVTLTGHHEYSRAVYRYDLLGRRTQKILYRHGEAEENAEVIHFDWSGLRMVGERSSRTPQRRTRYIYGEGGWEPLARVDSVGGDDPGEVFWYHTELNGLPERMTDEYGERVWQGRFSAWGETEHESSPRGLRQNLRFQGQYFDAETGLHYSLFRYYDPVGGRFTQTDPIGLAGGLNLYAYAPNPLSWVDPLGLSKCKSDFYVGPAGASATMPSTAYRYMSTKFSSQTMERKSAPLSYFGYTKYKTGHEARDAYQIFYEKGNPDSWSDARLLGEFDTLQLYKNGVPQVKVPLANGDKGPGYELFTSAYPQYGKGGALQLLPAEKGYSVFFDKISILPE
uniref:RHS repeat-associated core domain-containing protein n=2 Tax=Erwinia amylovora TaxID=552 RepID=UPI001965A71A